MATTAPSNQPADISAARFIQTAKINDVLPPELIALVFEHLVGIVLAWDEEDDEIVDEDEGDPPYSILKDCTMCGVVMSQVCAHWRAIALKTPILWTVIYVDHITPVEGTDLFFQRAKEAPVELTVDFSSTESNQDHAFTIISSIRTHISHIKYLQWTSSNPEIIAVLLDAFVGLDAPLLTTISLNDETSSEQEYDGMVAGQCTLFNGLGSTPQLKVVQLWSIPLKWTNHSFQNLSELHLCYLPDGSKPSLDQFRDILQTSLGLEQLVVHNGVVHPTELANAFQQPRSPRPILLSSLKSLLLRDFDAPSILNQTLRLISAPNLSTLHLGDLHANAEGEPVDFGSTFGLLASPAARENLMNVESLKVGNFRCASTNTFESFLCALPKLQKLHIVCLPPTDVDRPDQYAAGFLRAFLLPAHRERNGLPPLPVEVACPLLEEFTAWGMSGKVLHKLASMRRQIGKPLKSISYEKRDDIDITFVKGLEAMGVDVAEYSESDYEEEDEDEEEDDDDDIDEGDGDGDQSEE